MMNDEQIRNYDTCHKCGGVGILLYSDCDGHDWHHDYECEDCEATWGIGLELTPTTRNNDVG
tara:strand:- start:879 stop:1064 length:186 start_codon:yes stop_codon:yes gene_type:complete